MKLARNILYPLVVNARCFALSKQSCCLSTNLRRSPFLEDKHLTHAHALASSVDKRDARHPSGHAMESFGWSAKDLTKPSKVCICSLAMPCFNLAVWSHSASRWHASASSSSPIPTTSAQKVDCRRSVHTSEQNCTSLVHSTALPCLDHSDDYSAVRKTLQNSPVHST
jgi:hypothetical protein